MVHETMCFVGSIRVSKVLQNKETIPTMISDEENDEFIEKVYSTIKLCQGNEVFRELV